MIPPLKVLPSDILENSEVWIPGYPDNFEYPIRFANANFIQSNTVEIVSQFISGGDYWAELITIMVREDSQVNLIVNYPVICLALLINGDMNVQTLGQEKVVFTAGTKKLFYLPAGHHKIHLLKDKYVVLYFVPPVSYLEEMALEDPGLQRLLKKFSNSGSDGDMLNGFHFPVDIFKSIQHIEKKHPSKAAINLFIRQNILKLLAGYHEQLSGIRKVPSDLTIRQKAYLVRDHILNNLGNPNLGGLKEFARDFFASRKVLSTEFKELTGQTILEYVTNQRLQKALELLRNTEKKVFEIAILVGYSDTATFIRKFKKKFGYPPGRAKGI